MVVGVGWGERGGLERVSWRRGGVFGGGGDRWVEVVMGGTEREG